MIDWVDNRLISALRYPRPMRNPLRTALTCLLMLALAAQSMAALGMQMCSQSQSSGTTMAAHHAGMSIMVEAVQASAHGEHHASESIPSPVSVADNSLCSLCAFCVSAATLSTVVSQPAPLQSVEPNVARRDAFIGFIAETPERPPRLILA